MDQLTRFARQLVERLGTRPGGANRPVSVSEVRKGVLPYRAQRRSLGLESVEDYETVLLRLIAEERGYVRTLPPTAALRCREELAHSNPDLGLLDEIAEATIQMTSLAAGKIMEDEDPSPAAPAQDDRGEPQARDDGEGTQAREDKSPSARADAPGQPDADRARKGGEGEGPSCRHCHGALPAGRTVTFCPWCGERLIPLTCERCGTELVAGWRHCITCGSTVRDPFPPA